MEKTRLSRLVETLHTELETARTEARDSTALSQQLKRAVGGLQARRTPPHPLTNPSPNLNQPLTTS